VLPYEALRVTTIQQPLKNPHHTNTSPTTTMSLVNTIKHVKPLKSFGDPEFSVWKSQLADILKNEGLWARVDGGVTKPFLSTSLFNGPHDPFFKFRNKQLQASGLIQLSMDPAIGPRPECSHPSQQAQAWRQGQGQWARCQEGQEDLNHFLRHDTHRALSFRLFS
jgi:hypothetical protein